MFVLLVLEFSYWCQFSSKLTANYYLAQVLKINLICCVNCCRTFLRRYSWVMAQMYGCINCPFSGFLVHTGGGHYFLFLFSLINFGRDLSKNVRFGWASFLSYHVMSCAQVINLTVYEYSEQRQPHTSLTSSVRHSGAVARRPASKSRSGSVCSGAARRYAVVKERSNPVDASICASAHLTEHVTRRRVFTSVSYVIELRVVARKTRDTAFLIQYQGPFIQRAFLFWKLYWNKRLKKLQLIQLIKATLRCCRCPCDVTPVHI